MTITALTVPSITDTANFESEVDAFIPALATLVSEINAQVWLTFTPLTTVPSLSDPTNFSTDAAAFFSELSTFISQVNVQIPGALTPLPTLPVAGDANFETLAEAAVAALTLLVTELNAAPICDAADFDGINDYMLRGAELTGIADSKSGIFSGWLRLDAITALHAIFANSIGGAGFRIFINGSSQINIRAANAAGTTILDLHSSAYSAGATWRHVLLAWNLAAAATHLYITDISDKTAVTVTNDTIDYTKGNWAVGSYTDGSLKLDGCLGDVYFAPGQYLDFSVEANRRKFISASGDPVPLGIDGSSPTGIAPVVFLHIDPGEAVANFATNRGSGGNFTITGTLTTASTSPGN